MVNSSLLHRMLFTLFLNAFIHFVCRLTCGEQNVIKDAPIAGAAFGRGSSGPQSLDLLMMVNGLYPRDLTAFFSHGLVPCLTNFEAHP